MMSHNSSNENIVESVADVFIQKIEVLLRHQPQLPSVINNSNSRRVWEQQLVALVLLTRVPNDDNNNNNEFVRLMMESSKFMVPHLADFIRNGTVHHRESDSNSNTATIDDDDDDDDDENLDDTTGVSKRVAKTTSSSSTVHFLIVRLMTQLLHRLYRTLVDEQIIHQQLLHDDNIDSLRNYDSILQSLLHVYSTTTTHISNSMLDLHSPQPPQQQHLIAVVHQKYEFMACLQSYIQYLYERNSNNNKSGTTTVMDDDDGNTTQTVVVIDLILDAMWKLTWYENHSMIPVSSSSDNSSHHPTALMEQTLTTLLNETSCCGSVDDDDDVGVSTDTNHSKKNNNKTKYWYEKMIQCLLRCTYMYMEVQQQQLLPVQLPSFVTVALSEWLQHSQQPQQNGTMAKKVQQQLHNATNGGILTKQEKSSLWAYLFVSILFRYWNVRTITTFQSNIDENDDNGDDKAITIKEQKQSMMPIDDCSVHQQQLPPWTSVQQLLFICIVSIDDRSYDVDDDADDCDPFLWLPHHHHQQQQQQQRPKTLRTMAWSCVAFMFVAMGLETTWMNHERMGGPAASGDNVVDNEISIASFNAATSISSCRYGTCKNLCTLLRLASGEWKIQLTTMIDHVTTTTIAANAPTNSNESSTVKLKGDTAVNNPSSKMTSSSDSRIVLSIAEILIATVSYLVQLIDDSDPDATSTNSLPTPDAIQHLQKSLMEFHIVSIQYLQLVKFTNRNADVVDCIDRCVIRVFATLTADSIPLTPIRVNNNKGLTNPVTNNGVAGPSTIQQFDALYVALDLVVSVKNDDNKSTIDFETLRMLLLCVMNVLASVHGNTEKESMILDSNIIGDIFMSFVALFLRSYDYTTHSNLSETIGWLCDVIELAVQLRQEYHGDGDDRNQYQSIIIAYLQKKHVLYTTDASAMPCDSMISALRTMVECYVTLQGITTPSVSDSAIVTQILQL